MTADEVITINFVKVFSIPPARDSAHVKLNCCFHKCVVELTEQPSNHVFEVLQDWEAVLNHISDELEPLP